MAPNTSRELQSLKKDSNNKVPVIKGQDWKKSEKYPGWSVPRDSTATMEYKSPLQPAGEKKDRGQNAKKKPHVFSNHWDQDPRDPDYVEEEETEDSGKTTERDESDFEDEYLPKKKAGEKTGGEKKRTFRSGGKRA